MAHRRAGPPAPAAGPAGQPDPLGGTTALQFSLPSALAWLSAWLPSRFSRAFCWRAREASPDRRSAIIFCEGADRALHRTDQLPKGLRLLRRRVNCLQLRDERLVEPHLVHQVRDHGLRGYRLRQRVVLRRQPRAGAVDLCAEPHVRGVARWRAVAERQAYRRPPVPARARDDANVIDPAAQPQPMLEAASDDACPGAIDLDPGAGGRDGPDHVDVAHRDDGVVARRNERQRDRPRTGGSARTTARDRRHRQSDRSDRGPLQHAHPQHPWQLLQVASPRSSERASSIDRRPVQGNRRGRLRLGPLRSPRDSGTRGSGPSTRATARRRPAPS